MSNETCTLLKLKMKLLLARNKIVRARKFELLILGQPKAKTERMWCGRRQPEGGDCCPTAPSPATSLASHHHPPPENPRILELQKEIRSNWNEKLAVADKSASKSSYLYHD